MERRGREGGGFTLRGLSAIWVRMSPWKVAPRPRGKATCAMRPLTVSANSANSSKSNPGVWRQIWVVGKGWRRFGMTSGLQQALVQQVITTWSRLSRHGTRRRTAMPRQGKEAASESVSTCLLLSQSRGQYHPSRVAQRGKTTQMSESRTNPEACVFLTGEATPPDDPIREHLTQEKALPLLAVVSTGDKTHRWENTATSAGAAD